MVETCRDTVTSFENILVEVFGMDSFGGPPEIRTGLGENAIIDHYFEKGRDSYKLRLAMREVQKRLNEANEKYRNANERIDELKGKLNAANEKYKSLTAQSLSVRDQLKAENEKLRGELRTCESRLQSENPSSGKWAGGFDFSVDGTEIG